MTKKKAFTIAALALSAVAIPALAWAPGSAEGGPRGNPMKMADANNDGIITRAEVQTASTTGFAKMDVNKDGKLDQTDRDAGHAQRRAEMFAKIDVDNNGSITRAEWEAADAARAEKRADRAEMRGEGGGKHGRGHHGKRGGGDMMKAADTNKDGSISAAEFQTGALAMFTRADANSDGQVTSAEQDAARAKMREAWSANRAAAPAPAAASAE